MATTLIAAAAKTAAGTDSTVAKIVHHLPHVRTNVSSNERWLSVAAGSTLALLAAAGRTPPLASALLAGGLLYRASTGNCMVYQALGVSTADSTNPNAVVAGGHGSKVEHAVTVNKSLMDAYTFWRNFENLPNFMTHLIDVDTTTDGKSHWVARGPLGVKFEWDAEIVTDTPGEVIAWRSLDGADVDTAGSVRFTRLPGGRGTEVRVTLKYDPPGGKVSTALAKLVGQSPEAQIRADMRRFKQLLEAGELPTTEGQPHGAR